AVTLLLSMAAHAFGPTCFSVYGRLPGLLRPEQRCRAQQDDRRHMPGDRCSLDERLSMRRVVHDTTPSECFSDRHGAATTPTSNQPSILGLRGCSKRKGGRTQPCGT